MGPGRRVPANNQEEDAWRDPQWKGEHHRLNLDRRLGRHRREKGEARKDATTVRAAIQAGTFRKKGGGVDAIAPLTFGDVVRSYVSKHVETPRRRPAPQQVVKWHLELLKRTGIPASGGATIRLEQKPIAAICKADVEAIREACRASGRKGVKGGEAGINRVLARLRHLFSWAIAEGLVDQSPFRRHGVTVVKLETRAEAARTRRLVCDEEARLLQHANEGLTDYAELRIVGSPLSSPRGCRSPGPKPTPCRRSWGTRTSARPVGMWPPARCRWRRRLRGWTANRCKTLQIGPQPARPAAPNLRPRHPLTCYIKDV
jgi:hypothetical protein